ncbi:MAG: YraN family protein [Patescibacteria group bacterium]
MTYKSQLGAIGEDIACQHLIKKCYKIIKRNYRKPWGEIDIIAKSPDKILVFVEVKTVSGGSNNNARLQPEEQLTKAKLQKLQRTASLYAGNFPKLIDDEKGWRIDLIAITANNSTLTISSKNCLINHYENI